MSVTRWLSVYKYIAACRKCGEYDFTVLKRACLSVILLTVLVTTVLVSWLTPLPIYLLDRLNVRPFFIPDLRCTQCNHFSVKYIIENENFCKDSSGNNYDDVALLILVASYHPNVNARQAIRATWASVREHNGQKIRTLFIFGTHNDKNFNSQVKYELDNYGDVIQADFADRYRTLTNKTMIALQWVQKNCPLARYVLKTDDDAFNIPQRYVEYLNEVKTDPFIGGYCFTVKPDRSPGSKFYTPYDQYPDSYYPTYCSGPGYVLSQSAIGAVLNVANNVKYFHMEDVFVSGVCRLAASIPYTQIPGTVIWQGYFDKCSVATWLKNSHNVLPEQAIDLWNNVVLPADKLKDCSVRHTKIAVGLFVFAVLWCKLLHSLFKRR